ncbi:response regulator receiver protein [Schinkia azotoformans LMG 9581]|uniref:Response regulator receiver protein n=1 Tax=Schinkia azotoformans LMG 9581 TaxID=1131731 RepID=K6E3H8_SCHAZ|nr:response regulator receiver protein [Schinkia azotoformans LMG 9581]
MKGILIVDDSLFVRRLLKDILMEANYTVFIEAKNGIEAIEKYKIFSPELNGIDALKGNNKHSPRCKGHYVYSFRRTEGDH